MITRDIRRTGQMAASDPFAGYSLREDHSTELATTYSGPCQVCIVKFVTGPEMPWGLPDPVNNWASDHYFDNIKSAVEDNGGQLLRARLYRDKSPTTHTDWKAEITATVPVGASQDAPMGQAGMSGWWAIVIAAGFVGLLAYFVLRPVIESTSDLVWGPEGTTPFLGLPWVFWLGAGLIVLSMYNTSKRGKSA